MTDASSGAARPLVFRLPRSAYLAVLFLLACAIPVALADDRGDKNVHAAPSWRLLFLLVPILATVFIARTATFASAEGLRVRAVFGSRSLPWEQLRGLSVGGRAVYAVLTDGSVRLPCVGTPDLAAIARVSAGRLPQVRQPVPKYAPPRRRRR